MSRPITIGCFPYSPRHNPYQKLFSNCLEDAGLKVNRIPPAKFQPLQTALTHGSDLIHLDWPHDWYTGRNFLVQTFKSCTYKLGLKQLKKHPSVWTAHNLIAHDSKNPGFDRKMIQKLINSVTGIMVLSENSKELIKDIYRIPNNVEIQKIYHGHYIDCYPNECDFQTSRDVLGIPYEKFVYLTPGAIKPYKGHLELIESFFRVSQPDDVLVIAGGGQQSFINQLKSIIESYSGPKTGSIKLIPKFIEPEQFQYFFNAANATVLPFKRVLNSGSLLLAMSFGSPVIAPRTGSIPEIAPPEFYFGYTAEETLDKSHLRQALIDAKKSITGHSSKQKIRKGIIEFTKTNYNWEQVGMNLSHWYSTLLAKYESN